MKAAAAADDTRTMNTTEQHTTSTSTLTNGAGVSPEPLMQMLQGLQASGILKAGIELGVFDQIAAGRTEAGSIADGIQAPPRTTRILLDALAALGVLSAGDGYRLSPGAETFLLSGRPTYLGGAADIFTGDWAWANYGRLADVVRNGGTLMDEDAETPSLDFWATFASSSTGIAGPAAQALADVLDPWSSERDELAVLDIACGSGLYGLTIAAAHPGARLTLLDWDNVLERARPNVARFGIADRVDYIDGDVFETDLGGPYDLIIASHFLHHFSEPRCADALRRCTGALRPGGRIAINEFTSNAPDPADEPFPALFSTVMLCWTAEGAAHTVETYARLLAEAGFTEPEIHDGRGMPSRFLIAEREPS